MPTDFTDSLQVLQALPEPVIVVEDEPFTVRYVNPAAEEFFNASQSALLGQGLSTLFGTSSPVVALLEQARRENRPVAEHELVIESKRLPAKTAAVSAAPLMSKDALVVTFRERSFANTLDRQWTHRGAARSVSGMAAMLAHEVRNPLLAINGAAQLLEMSVGEDDLQLTRLIAEEVGRIRGLVDRMEAFGDGVPAEREAVNIHSVLDHVKLAAKAGFGRHIEFVEAYDPSLPPVLANRDQLVQIFTNLVKNASEALPESGRIKISTAYQHGFRVAGPAGGAKNHLPVAVTIEDNGPGIAESMRAQLFEPFVTTKAQGTGLGLALVAKLIADHGGAISFESSPGATPVQGLIAEGKRSMSAKILVADDDKSIRTVLSQALSRQGYDVEITDGTKTLWQWVEAGKGDVVITDVIMPDGNGLDLVTRIREVRPELPIIVMSAQNTLKTAIQATERGAFDYLPKPFDLKVLMSSVERALTATPPELNHDDVADLSLPLIGRSAAMQEIYRLIARLTSSELTILLTGEPGTGKELVAKALHMFGPRKTALFVSVNLGALPGDVVETELFGSAVAPIQTGRFQQAAGGTLFLDGIGELSLEAQARLLRYLQAGEIMPVGSHKPVKLDVRVIAATQSDLRLAVRQGQFREDLFYRLNVVPIRMPPLRERLDDLPLLIRHFAGEASGSEGKAKTFTEPALARLQAHDWPGNVRELENLVRRLDALHVQPVIDLALVEAELLEPVQAAENFVRVEGLSGAVERYLRDYFAAHQNELPSNGVYERVMREVERPLIILTLAATKGNQIKAAEVLGLNRNTLRKKIRDLDIPLYKGQK